MDRGEVDIQTDLTRILNYLETHYPEHLGLITVDESTLHIYCSRSINQPTVFQAAIRDAVTTAPHHSYTVSFDQTQSPCCASIRATSK